MQPDYAFIPQFTISDRLRKAREHARLDQTQLAKRIGISRTSVSSYEAGRIAKPRQIVLNAWALATGVPVQWLETGTAPDRGPENDGAPAVGAGASEGLLRLDSNQQPSD
ncbi:helix-turn-helix domain-containing protein [Actinomyces bowdenii]|uniref:helix-turn-helix domain-containing protein n=1 Tax=Actinomyces bowdenii TaxID=131109 RepID=UPI0035A2BA24